MRLLDILPAENWMANGICAGRDLAARDLWFSDSKLEREHAKKACQRCPVLEQCADYAQAIRPTHGVWAGETFDTNTGNLTPEQRKIYRALRGHGTLGTAADHLGISIDNLTKQTKNGPTALRSAYNECKKRGQQKRPFRKPLTDDEKQERIAVMTAALSRAEAAKALGRDTPTLTAWIHRNGTKQEISDWIALPIKETEIV